MRPGYWSAHRWSGDLRPPTDALALALLAILRGGLVLTRTRRSTEPLRTALDLDDRPRPCPRG